MNFTNIRVLVLEGYARQSLPLIRAFHMLGCNVTALCNSRLDVAYTSRYTDQRIIGVCDRNKVEETTKQIRQLLLSHNFDVVVPTVDFSAALLSKNKNEFSQYARIVSNNWSVYQLAGDKNRTMEVCMNHHIPAPYTILNAKSIQDIVDSDIQYPIVVKPAIGYGAIGFKIVNSRIKLIEMFSDQTIDCNQYVFQEYIPQTDIQYECAMFMDEENTVKTALVFSKNRWFPISGGSSTLNITVDRPDIVESCSRLLRIIGWRGAADIDLIQDPRDNVAKIMEINPRVSGSVKICFAVGVDQAKQMLELAYQQPVTQYDSYPIGQRLRCSQTDLLWFLESPNRFRAEPSWFSNYRTKDQIFAWSDPIPWFAFTIGGLLRLKNEMGKRG